MIVSYRLLLLLFLFIFCTESSAQIKSSVFKKGISTSVEQWQVHYLVFKAKSAGIENPFDVGFGAIYTWPNGEQMKVPGFYDGSNNWVGRFSSKTTGNWTFETYSSRPELSGLKGSINITPNTRPKQKGAVIIDPKNPQAFVYEDGSPHFLLAFELDWLFALDYKEPNGMPRTSRILDDVSANGYGLYDEKGNYLMMIPKESERVNVIIPKPENGKAKVI